MARIDAASAVVLCLVLAWTWMPAAEGVKKRPASAARKEDVPFIKCQVCEKVASQLYLQVQKKQAQISPKKISEYEVIEIAENICNLKKEEADWMLKIDIVEQGDKLELVDQDTEGICNSECKTIEKACQEVMGYSDTDVAEYLYNSKPQIDSLVDFLCKDLSRACSSKPPPLPKDRTPGEAFMPKPAKDAEMEKIMRSMEGMPGAPGMKMYSRDELMNMKNLGEEDDDEEEDEDEDAHFPSKLGKVLREKEGRKGDWKQKLTEGIKTTGEVLKRHADKVSFRLQKWWRGIRRPDSKKNSKTGKSEL
ncbi:hypothetical protein BT93_L3884 [Corymbia citriodora subsp. variegata]|uniref:Saposin B-type domain-containing protein n=1 Tax=Corymbia citriodora subsp. variegata TaxID=360336 RepID=A0A8T0CYZ3_CORYI|nr:hypothetical protein BT93_L3884 [Corymbia citriodora subsp. variegata]